MTIEEMLKMEPLLQGVIDVVKRQNELAATRKIYFADVYATIKPDFQELVGWYADKSELRNHRDYSRFIQYLDSLATNML